MRLHHWWKQTGRYTAQCKQLFWTRATQSAALVNHFLAFCLPWKRLKVIETSATLRIGSPYVFSGKIYEFGNKNKKNAITLKRLKVEIWILDRRWSTYKSFFVQILEAIGHATQVSEPKNEMPIVALNSSSSKTNRTRGIKVSNLEASGQTVSALKNKLWRFRHFFFLSLFIKQIKLLDKNSETTKARNLKFGQMISLYMNLHPSSFGGATSCGLGQMHPKLVTAKFIKWF